MIAICRKFLSDRLKELLLEDGVTTPFSDGTLPPPPEGEEPDPEAVLPVKNIFFGELPLDFLKDNDYAVCCLPLQDRTRKYGRLIAKVRDLEAKTQTLTRRRYHREILYRCLIYARYDDLWGDSDFTGLVEQFIQGVAKFKVISDAQNNCIMVDPQDAARPWDSNVETDKKLRRPPLAIVRVQFAGGVHTATTDPLITAVEITPQIQ